MLPVLPSHHHRNQHIQSSKVCGSSPVPLHLQGRPPARERTPLLPGSSEAEPRRPAPRAYLGAGPRAVHDGVAAVQRERVLQLGQPLLREVVSGVDHPAIGLGEQGLLS